MDVDVIGITAGSHSPNSWLWHRVARSPFLFSGWIWRTFQEGAGHPWCDDIALWCHHVSGAFSFSSSLGIMALCPLRKAGKPFKRALLPFSEVPPMPWPWRTTYKLIQRALSPFSRCATAVHPEEGGQGLLWSSSHLLQMGRCAGDFGNPRDSQRDKNKGNILS